jgi:lipopolysaccharide transport system permease protein
MTPSLGYWRSLRVLFGFRERLLQSVRQEIRQRYAGSVLGLAWTVLYPLLLLSLYSVVYVAIFKVRPASLDAYSYVILVFSGLVPLLAFNEALMASLSSLAANRALLMNTVFPAELIPVRAVLAAQVPSLFAMLVTLVGGYASGRTGIAAVVAVPFLWLLLLLFVTGLGWFLSLVTLIVRDVQHVIGLALMVLMILSPFAYTPDMVPAGLRVILYLNPLSYFVLAFQECIAYGSWPSAAVLLPAVALAAGSFLLGFWFFRSAKFVFFDYV